MDTVIRWVTGNHLTASDRVWTALAPAIVLALYFFVGLAVYVVRTLVWGPAQDREVASRGSSFLAGMWIRYYFVWVIRPVWLLLQRLGIPPTAVTTLSTLLSLASGVSLAAGRFALGGWLYIFSGICDFLDGRLARAQNRASPSGAALDSVLDRYNESAVLVGLAIYYRDSWVLVAVLLALVGSLIVPYVRARGEALGVQVRVGLMQRPERILYLGVAVALSPVVEALVAPGDAHPIHRLAVLGIVLVAITSQLTGLRRLLYLLGALGDQTWPHRSVELWARPVRPMVFSALATACDFALVLVLVALAQMAPWLATAIGCGLGAVVSFLLHRAFTPEAAVQAHSEKTPRPLTATSRADLPEPQAAAAGASSPVFPAEAPAAPAHRSRRSRRWALVSSEGRLTQLGRYGFVSLTSALLNAGGVAVLLLLPGMDYRLAWLVVRGAVFVAWNSPLHHEYVFEPPAPPGSPLAREEQKTATRDGTPGRDHAATEPPGPERPPQVRGLVGREGGQPAA